MDFLEQQYCIYCISLYHCTLSHPYLAFFFFVTADEEACSSSEVLETFVVDWFLETAAFRLEVAGVCCLD